MFTFGLYRGAMSTQNNNHDPVRSVVGLGFRALSNYFRAEAANRNRSLAGRLVFAILAAGTNTSGHLEGRSAERPERASPIRENQHFSSSQGSCRPRHLAYPTLVCGLLAPPMRGGSAY